MYKLYRYFIVFMLLIPEFAFSQYEGGFVDNMSSDMISRLSIKDMPISDIIEYNDGLITYTDDSLFFYNVLQEEAQALIKIGYAEAEFVDLKINASGSYLFFNTFDASGNFQTAQTYNLTDNTLSDLGSVILEDVFLVADEIYLIGKESPLGDYGLYYQSSSGKIAGLTFQENYQLEISSDGKLWILANNLSQSDIILYYIDTQTEPAKLNNFSQPNDVSFTLINDQVYYSSQDKVIKVAPDLNKTEAVTLRGESFFKLGAGYIGFYVSASNNVEIVDTNGNISSLSDFVNLGAFLDSNLQNVLQLSNDYVALVNGNNEVMIINSLVEFVNQGNLFSFTNTPFYGKISNQRYLSLYSSETLIQKSDELLYYDLDANEILVDKDFADYEEVGYNFRPEFATTADNNFVVAYTPANGFELNLLSETDGFQVAEEVTNDDFSQQFLINKGVGEVLEEYSTYPKRLISLNNTLYYLAHLASGTYDGYYFLYKVNEYPTNIDFSNNTVSEAINSEIVVATISSTDFDDSEFSYSLISGEGDADNNLFSISQDELITSGGFDYESKASLSIRIQTTDPHGLTYEEVMSISVTDANDSPADIKLSNTSILEGEAEETKVADLSADDQDTNDTFNYTLISGDGSEDNGSFLIDNSVDPSVLRTTAVLDYEVQNLLNIRIQVEDETGATFSKSLGINVTDANDPPDSLALKLEANEFAPKVAEEIITEILIRDQDLDTNLTDTYNSDYSISFSEILGNNGAENFYISYTGEAYVLRALNDIEYDPDNQENNMFTFQLYLEDANHSSGKITNYTQDFSLEVYGENSPTAPKGIILTNNSMNENIEENPNGLIIGELSTTDQNNGSHSYSIVDTQNGDSKDNSLFEIIDSNQLAFKSFENINHEKDSIYQINLKTTNNETGLSTEELFDIIIEEYLDAEQPKIEPFFPENNIISVSEDGNIELDIKITDWELDTVKVLYGGIIQENFNKEAGVSYQEVQEKIEFPLPDDQFDAFGLKVQFIAEDKSDNVDSSDVFYFYRELLDNNPYSNLPAENLGTGRLSTDYKMLSIPYDLNNNEIKSFLEQQLGVVYSINDFRILHWNPQNEEYEGIPRLVNFKPGESYWFTTTVENPEITFGSGKLYQYKENNAFVWQLEKGWNQIGNPYPIALDWGKITEGTALEGSTLHKYDSVYEASETLEPYEGAFVLVEEDLQLKASINSNSNESDVNEVPFSWKLDFEVEQNEFINTGRIGMHSDASVSLDKFDLANPPHFSKYLEINLNKEERFYSNYKNDVVNNQREYDWDLTINSHQHDSPTTLSWNSAGILPNQLFLVEMNSLMMLDMALQNEYYFTSERKPKFKIIYRKYNSKPINLGALQVGQPYPNPMTDFAIIGMNLPDSKKRYRISAEITDLSGKIVKQLRNNTAYKSGFHRLKWDGVNDDGNEAASGIYLYRLSITGDKKDVFTGRIMKLN
ncbi:Cadherin domain-containing protein [Marivirga sericea]|uniref:Cadherin domain-containing protein n=1 Tax=Marivirga sericea TaxID=1028 RepID=A0A1X7JC93_9BACT|nr:cadherin repeat domain-containing protein [Marivirga sericea]SMG25266.1 Cadherin domain-containing protein [Marivirga sericea]